VKCTQDERADNNDVAQSANIVDAKKWFAEYESNGEKLKIMKIYLCLLMAFLFEINIQAQEKEKDTLFFKFDRSYIKESESESDLIFSLKDTDNTEMFYFKRAEVVNSLKPKRILCLKETIRQPNFYNKSNVPKLNNNQLLKYFSSKITYLVKEKNGKKEFIRIEPVLAIAD